MNSFFFSSRRRHTRYWRDWSSDVCSSDLVTKNNFFMDLNYGSFDNRNFGFAGGYNVTDKLYVNYGFNYLNSEDYREHEEKENKIYLLGFDYKINAKNRSEEHTSELQSRQYLVCRLL